MWLLGLLLFASVEAGADPNIPSISAAPCVACEARVTDPRELFDTKQWRALKRGEILLEHSDAENNGSQGVSEADVLIPYAANQVWSVLTDFEQWPEFMPLLISTEIAKSEEDRTWVRQAYRVMLVDLQHTTIYDLAPTRGQLSWSLDRAAKHDIKSTVGRWTLVPVDRGQKTILRYRAEMDAGRAVPAFVQKLLRKRSLKRLISSLRTEVDRRYGVAAR